MYKLKLKIRGMNCQACVQTIEEKLMPVDGILSAKVNYESQKAVIIYDEQKIKSEEIRSMIKTAGSFDSEQISDSAELTLLEVKTPNTAPAEKSPECLPGLNPKFSRIFFWNGLLTSISIISIIINIIFGINFYKTGSNYNIASKAKAVIPTTQPTATPPTPSQPERAAIQTFTITKDDHIRGNKNAKVILIEYSDFECPFCKRFHPTMQQVMSAYKDQVAWVYRHFPLSFHANAAKEAEASECANELGGNDVFWKYTDAIFERTTSNGTGFALDKLVPLAKELGLPENKFRECLDSGKYAAHVNQDEIEGQSKGVQGTPATFVNGQLVSGAVPYENLKQVIDNAINKK